MDDKPDETSGGIMLLMIQMARGGVVFDAEVAVRLAELLCEVHYGKSEVERQKPFVATDKGELWRVEGSWNRDHGENGPGMFFLSVNKLDCRLTDFGMEWALQPHPSVVPIIEEHLRSQGSEDPE